MRHPIKALLYAIFTKKYALPSYPPFVRNDNLDQKYVNKLSVTGFIYVFPMVPISIISIISAIPGSENVELSFLIFGYLMLPGPIIFLLTGILLVASPRRFYGISKLPIWYGVISILIIPSLLYIIGF